jgi:tRNA dimethylallyltransferase
MPSPLPHIIVIAGPTASGKSDFAVDLALSLPGGAEIISADSRQVYTGLDIGTGKITPDEMKGVPHHMLDVVEPSQIFTVSDYKSLATPIIQDILARGKTPIICGGSGQYIDALIYDKTFAESEPNETLRAKLETLSTEVLFTQLTAKDPRRAREIDKHNRARIIRALELVEAHGHVPELAEPQLMYDVELYLMSPSKELLRERILKRLEKRLDNGMLEEAKQLLAAGLSKDRMRTIGLEYKWMSSYLNKEITYDKMQEQIFFDSWHYAKRQMTWNKKYESFAKKIFTAQ